MHWLGCRLGQPAEQLLLKWDNAHDWGEEEKKEGGVVHAQGLLLEQLLLNVQGPINERWTRDQPGGKVPSL